MVYRVEERPEVLQRNPGAGSPLGIQPEDALLGEADNFQALEV